MQTQTAKISGLLLICLAVLAQKTQSASVGHANKIHRNFEDVSGDGRYLVEWEVNFATNIIMFDVSVKTTGFVGFGISPGGRMMGADIVIGGLYPNGTVYFSDRHGVGDTTPVVDDQQDWVLVGAYENSTHTRLKFYRLLDTCDKSQDVKISPDTVKIIWSLGQTDEIEYHRGDRGVVSANLLDPPMPPVDTSRYDKWTLATNVTMPTQETSYWCTMYRSPAAYSGKRHVVGFNTVLDTAESLKHTHHFSLYRCQAPDGVDPATLFERFVGKEGQECYVPPTQETIPTELCRVMLYGWAIGGKPSFFPEHVGYPITELGATEYLMLEVHYNNPDKLSGVRFKTAVEIFNSPELRQYDAGVFLPMAAITFSSIVPPNATSWVSIGHCGSECTARKLRPEGIKLVNVALHAHLLGRKMKLRHFRGTTELPWVSVDDNYDFDYQQNRPLREEVTVLPGDQLTMECTLNSTGVDGITIAGLSTHSEMCQGIIWYYPRSELQFCESAYPEYKIFMRYGIEDIVWDNVLEPPIVTAPKEMAGKTFLQVVNEQVDWTPEAIAEFQRELRFTEHYEASCGLTPDPEGK